MNTNIYQKLEQARKLVRESKIKKEGRNDYSKYDYFTPEQVEKLVANACEKTGLIVLCNLEKDEYGLFQSLNLINTENPEEKLPFILRTEKGEVKATNSTQQMGSTDTYSERYIKMKVFQIKDNNLDPDNLDNRDSKRSEVKESKTARDLDL